MSLSAPDERKLSSPLYWSNQQEMSWSFSMPRSPSSSLNSKKRSFQCFSVNTSYAASGIEPPCSSQSIPSSLSKSTYVRSPTHDASQNNLSLLQRRIQVQPLTSLIPDRTTAVPQACQAEAPMEVDNQLSPSSHSSPSRNDWASFSSPLDGLYAAARDQADSMMLSDSVGSQESSVSMKHSQPISIPRRQGNNHQGSERPPFLSKSASSYECSPTGVEDDRAWFDSLRESEQFKNRARLASVCSSDAGSEYGGLGRKHLEEFIRMEISSACDNQSQVSSSPHEDSHFEGKYIGSYSPEARRKRIERFLEKRKRRVWSKKVDYDVRKNFANSRLRVKGRFVKKEDEELLCQLLSFT